MKRTLAILAIFAMLLLAFAGCTTTPATTTGTTATKATSATTAAPTETTAAPTEPEPTTPTVTWMMRDMGGLRVDLGLKVFDWLGEAGDLEIEHVMVAPDVYMDRLAVMVAGNDLPDIVNVGNQDLFVEAFTPDFALAQDIGPKGLLVPLTDYMAQMPHYELWLKKYADFKGSIVASDGNIYLASVIRDYSPTSSLGGVIRADLADTMTFGTFDDLFNTLQAMRADADGPIWTNRSGILNLNLLSYSFGTSLLDFPYYDQYAKTFINPVATQNFEDAVLFFRSLVEADILTPEWPTYPEPQWYADGYDGTCQFWVDNMMNVPAMDNGLALAGISGSFKAFVPPSYNGTFYGWPGKSRFSTTGSVISANTKALDNILAMFDWTYNEAASHDLLYWGEPGITCKQLASGGYGNPEPGIQLTEPFKKLMGEVYGIGENSNWVKVFTDAHYYNDRYFDNARVWAPAGKVYGDSVYTYSVPSVNLNEAAQAQFNEISVPLQTYIQETVTNFINGADIDWNEFVAKVESMGGNTLVDLYNG